MNKRHEQQTSQISHRDTSNLTLWFCLGMKCAPKEWFVERDKSYRDLWTISDGTGSLYNVAADVPCCPHCSESLHEAALEEKHYV